MTVHRSKSSQRASPEAERLVADAISLAASGSQIEDRFWEGRLSARLLKLMTSQNQNVIDAALDQTFRINTVAFEVLADCAETLAESQTMTIDQGELGCIAPRFAYCGAYPLSNSVGPIAGEGD
jgi:hypothetical protein